MNRIIAFILAAALSVTFASAYIGWGYTASPYGYGSNYGAYGYYGLSQWNAGYGYSGYGYGYAGYYGSGSIGSPSTWGNYVNSPFGYAPTATQYCENQNTYGHWDTYTNQFYSGMTGQVRSPWNAQANGGCYGLYQYNPTYY